MQNSLKELREAKGLTLKELAKLSGCGLSTINNFENGTTEASEEFLRKISSALNVPVEVILKKQPGAESSGGPLLRELSQVYRMPPRRKVPVVSWARNGVISESGLNYADLAGQIDEEVETDCKDANAFALILEGDSMEPAYMAGDRVVFAPNEVARNGDIVVARLAESGQVLFKRFFRTGNEGEKVRLESYNPLYKPREFEAKEFRFIYPAVDMIRKIRR